MGAEEKFPAARESGDHAGWSEGTSAASLRAIELAFVLALALLLCIGIFSYGAIGSSEDLAELRARARETANALARVTFLVKDAETGQRGYLLTGEAVYLAPYEEARRAIDAEFTKLRSLATADGFDTERLDRIGGLIEEKFAELADTIRVSRERGFDEAVKIVTTDRGRRTMLEIGALTAEIESVNRELIERRSIELDQRMSLAKRLSLFGSSIAFALVLGSALFIRRDSTRRENRREDLFRRLIETAEAIVLLRDPQGRIVFYNPYAEKLLGVPLAEARGKDWVATFIPEIERPRMREQLDQALREDGQRRYATWLVTPGGAVRTIEWRTQALRERGVVIGVLSAGQDVTELREMQKRALQRERLADIGAITAKIAHDLGNPLAAASIQVELVLRKIRRQGDQPLSNVQAPVEQLAADVKRLDALIRDLMAFARDQRLERHPVDLPELVENVARAWYPMAKEQRIELRTEIHDAALHLDADESKLHRVLDNLVKNAIEAIGEGPGEVELSIDHAGADRVRISVADDGPGIGEGVEVFQLFETTKKDGTGIGLAVSKQIAQAHGGELSYVRRDPRGTIFRLDLPLRFAGA